MEGDAVAEVRALLLSFKFVSLELVSFAVVFDVAFALSSELLVVFSSLSTRFVGAVGEALLVALLGSLVGLLLLVVVS